MRFPWQGLDRSRLFEVECRCGEVFRAPFDPQAAERRSGEPLLVPLTGACPWCGLRLEEIEPFADSPTPPPAPRSRA